MRVTIRKFTNSHPEDYHVQISQTAGILELRELIYEEYKVRVYCQELFYGGKQLSNDHSLSDYGIHDGHVISLVLKQPNPSESPSAESPSNQKEKLTSQISESNEVTSEYYKIGDYVDVQMDNGAWYEATIIKITAVGSSMENADDQRLIFTVKNASHVEDFEMDVMFSEIRPRSFYVYRLSELKRDMVVLANYNPKNNKALGNWFDFIVEEVSRTSNIRGTILSRGAGKPIAGCYVRMKNFIMRIENPVKLCEKSDEHIIHQPRKYPYNCEKCNDIQERKCRYCSCRVCGGKENWESTILCDECDDGYHLFCLKPPLKSVPDEEWYCPECKNDISEIVMAGENLKKTKRRVSIKNNRPDPRNCKKTYIIIPNSHDIENSSPPWKVIRSSKQSSEERNEWKPIKNHDIGSEQSMKHNIISETPSIKEQQHTEVKHPNRRIPTDISAEPSQCSVYLVLEQIQHLINNDKQNKKMWEECMKALIKGEQHFLGVVQDVFLCVCCQEVVRLPVTTECKHNICRDCLRRSFAFEIYSCPCCRYDLGKEYRLVVNKNLGESLERLFSVYNTRKMETQVCSYD